MTGRVLLDPVKGRQLYDSVIHDTKPVWVTKGAKPKPSTSATTSSTTPASRTAVPVDGTNAAQATCSL
jgi:hypothetical protein